MSERFVSKRGRPATSARLIAGLPYLQHAFDPPDEEIVWQWVENPYWQVSTRFASSRNGAAWCAERL